MDYVFRNISLFSGKTINFLFLFLIAAYEISAQAPRLVLPDEGIPEPAEDYTWWYVSIFILAIGLTAAIIWKFKVKNEEQANAARTKFKRQKPARDGSLDAEKEMEWLRKNQKIINKHHGRKPIGKKLPDNFPQTSRVLNRGKNEVPPETDENVLPIFSIHQLERSRPFTQLAISNDESLINAVEQAHDEFEEDEMIRELAMRVLAAFRTRNSVEALSQMAVYDLSSNLRSKAVAILAEFNHESVFEAILSACADPTREVKAAAARALFKITFDRSDAWTRIHETNDNYRMKHAARAAIAGEIVERSFDRLIHKDSKAAYEAFSLVALLINAGETREVFKAIEYHPNKNIKLALLHIIKVLKNEETLSDLYSLLEVGNLPDEIKKEVEKAIESYELVSA